MPEQYEFVVEKEAQGSRLDVYISQKCPELSRSRIQKLLEEGQLQLNHQTVKAGYKLKTGDAVWLEVPDAKPIGTKPEALPIQVLYEDEDLAVVSKPRGMVVHPAAGHPDGTLVNALLYRFEGQLSGINGAIRPGIVHRIDKDTSGLLMVCKSDRAHQAMSDRLKTHDITRIYEAITYGNIKESEGTVHAPIGRMDKDRKKMCIRWDGKDAITHYKVRERFGDFTYIEAQLETGRTHQIRVHMKSLGHPLLGDPVYGPANSRLPMIKHLKSLPGNLLEGQVLHAGVLGFVHPFSGEYMEFREELPAYFRTILTELRAGTERK